MVARRSLTKLERRAHMSLHNTVDVDEDSKDESSYTKDRFGKKQKITNHESE